MRKINTEMIRVKKTKSVEMYYDELNKELLLQVKNEYRSHNMPIPMSKIFQVKRGLESCVQRFYRKKVKKHEG